MQRRSLLVAALAGGVASVFGRGVGANEASYPYVLSDAQWQEKLSPDAYKTLRHEGTEYPYTSALNDEKRAGVYHCAGCDAALFVSETKFDSGTGWPSFYDVLPGAIGRREDNSLWMMRIEVHCANCGGHQGHVFDDGPAPTGLRYCINGVALRFEPKAA